MGDIAALVAFLITLVGMSSDIELIVVCLLIIIITITGLIAHD